MDAGERGKYNFQQIKWEFSMQFGDKFKINIILMSGPNQIYQKRVKINFYLGLFVEAIKNIFEICKLPIKSPLNFSNTPDYGNV
jgi:hypothetical protein